jgi:hypothetical protein
MGTAGSYPDVKRPGKEADHLPPSRTKVKNARSYTSTSPYVFVTWCLVKRRDCTFFTSLSSSGGHTRWLDGHVDYTRMEEHDHVTGEGGGWGLRRGAVGISEDDILLCVRCGRCMCYSNTCYM